MKGKRSFNWQGISRGVTKRMGKGLDYCLETFSVPVIFTSPLWLMVLVGFLKHDASSLERNIDKQLGVDNIYEIVTSSTIEVNENDIETTYDFTNRFVQIDGSGDVDKIYQFSEYDQGAVQRALQAGCKRVQVTHELAEVWKKEHQEEAPTKKANIRMLNDFSSQYCNLEVK